jgi:hypothetical protein
MPQRSIMSPGCRKKSHLPHNFSPPCPTDSRLERHRNALISFSWARMADR